MHGLMYGAMFITSVSSIVVHQHDEDVLNSLFKRVIWNDLGFMNVSMPLTVPHTHLSYQTKCAGQTRMITPGNAFSSTVLLSTILPSRCCVLCSSWMMYVNTLQS